MTVHLLKNNFTRGEFSPKAYSRIDLDFYGAGAETVRNWISNALGGLRRRSGTRFAGLAKVNTNVRFIEFVFSATGDAYIIEAGNTYFRFWSSDGTQVGAPTEVSTPYLAAEVDAIQFTQVGNAVYLAHPSYAPRKLVRNTHTSWTLSVLNLIDGPYLPINDTGVTVTGSANYNGSTTTTLTFSSASPINGGAGFTSADVGRAIRVRPFAEAVPGQGIRWIWGEIASVTSTTVISVNWDRVGDGTSADDALTGTAGNGTATKSWRLGAFGVTPGYPACVEVFESRLVWARTALQPRAVFLSRTGIPLDYAPSQGNSVVVADHGFSLDILAGKTDRILWLKEAPRLQIGTPAGIRTLGATDTGSSFSILNVSQRLEVHGGVSPAIPTSSGYSSFAAGRNGKTLHNVYYDYNINGLTAPDISRLHDHLLTGVIKKMAFAQAPEPVLWVLKADGTLCGVTFDQQERITGFHRHDVSGTIKTIGVIPDATRDVLWLLVDRVVNGATQSQIEYLEAPFETTDALADAFFVDGGTTYNGAPTNTVSGLTHLANTAVAVLADGSVKQGLTVSAGGVLTLANGQTASKIHVGRAITAEAKTLRPPYQQDDGPVLGRKQNVSNVLIDVLQTGSLKVGVKIGNNTSVQEIEHRRTEQSFGEPPDLKNGTYAVPVEDKWTGGGQIYLLAEKPLPAFVRSLLIRLETEHA